MPQRVAETNPDMTLISLGNSTQKAIIDDKDVWVMDRRRHINPDGYVVTTINRKPLNPITLYLHKLIVQVKHGTVVDHINHDLLDNTRKNLRAATRRENSMNRSINRTFRSSSFKGLTFYKRQRKWGARIRVNYKLLFLGLFESEADAARAYNTAAKQFYGKFACLNPT